MKRVSGTALYLAISLPFLMIPLALFPLGVKPDTGLGIALLAAILAAIVATWYVRSEYLASAEPRSIFWGMLVSALEVKVAFGSWVAYLVAANLLARPEIGIVLPLPPQPIRSTITGIAAVVLLIAAVYYAVTIAIERRRQPTSEPEA